MSDIKIQHGEPQPQGIGEDPLFAYTKLFVRFAQLVFASFEKGSYQWSADGETTDIFIADQGQLQNAVVEKRPSIICSRGPAQWSNISIDQMRDYDIQTGVRTHTDLIASTMVYNCIAREGLEAQRIAWIICYATRVLKRSLMRAGLHRVGENIDMGAETDAGSLLPDSASENRLVQVMVPFFFQDTWSVAPVDNLLLKGMDLRLTSQANGPTQEVPVPRPPALGGRVIQYDKVFSLTQRVSGAASPKKP